MGKPRRNVVIVGGGFAGVAASRALKDNHHVTLIDSKPHFEFLPNIHEIISSQKSPSVVRLSLARITRRRHQTFLQDTVVAVDPALRIVLTASDYRVPYDALILAPGGGPVLRGTPGADEHTHLFRSAEDARKIELRLKVLAGLHRSTHVTIVGGGFTGVEVLGEILRRYRKKHRMFIRIIESQDRLMSAWPGKLNRRVRKLAEKREVEVLTRTRVSRVDPAQLTLSTGTTLPSDLTIWTAGLAAPELFSASGIRLGLRGFAAVKETLQTAEYPNIFVAGDAAEPPSKVRKQGAEALRLGARAAKNVKRFLDGRELEHFRKKKTPLLITFGDLSSFLILKNDKVIESEAFEIGREAVFQENMALVDNFGRVRSFDRLHRRVRKSSRDLDWVRDNDLFDLVRDIL
jgi:NADH dehydrogenase